MLASKNILKGMLLLFISSCYFTCGTLGGIGDGYYFPISKKKLEMSIDTLYSKNPIYQIPEKCNIYNDWSKRGYSFLESRIFYFKQAPEEMYYVTFIGDSTELADTTKVGIGIRAVYNNNGGNNNGGYWFLNNDLDSKEEKRITKRFEDEIIQKLEEYTNTKVIRR